MSLIKKLIFKFLNQRIYKIYSKRFLKYHNTPKGVFWNSKLSQDLRLNIILDKILDNTKVEPFTIADIGCGYGRLFEIIRERNLEIHGIKDAIKKGEDPTKAFKSDDNSNDI